MLKNVSICAALLLAAAVFADSAEARQGFGGGRSMGGFSGARMGGFSGARMGGFSGARMGGFSGARGMAVAGPGRMGFAVRADSLVLCAWVQAGLLGQVEAIGPAAGGLAIGAGGIGAVDVSGPGVWALVPSRWPPRGRTTVVTVTMTVFSGGRITAG